MVLKIAWSVDDVAPIPEHGLNRGGGNFKYLFELNKELGVKFTLFVIPNYKGNYDIRNYKNWCDWIKSLDFCEIANHGFYHWNPVRNDWLEFIGITKPQAEILLKNSTEAFSEMGIYPNILKMIDDEAERQHRSRSNMLDVILRIYFNIEIDKKSITQKSLINKN